MEGRFVEHFIIAVIVGSVNVIEFFPYQVGVPLFLYESLVRDVIFGSVELVRNAAILEFAVSGDQLILDVDNPLAEKALVFLFSLPT